MAHDYETRTIDYTEEHPPEWASREDKLNFYPRRAAMFIVEEYRRVERELAERESATKPKHLSERSKAI